MRETGDSELTLGGIPVRPRDELAGLKNVLTPETPLLIAPNVVWDIKDPEFWEACMRRNPEITHYRVAENESACARGGDRTTADNWGEFLTDKKELVGCHHCLQWMHA